MKTKKQTKFYLGRLIVLAVILLALVGCGKETTKKETQNVENDLEMQHKKEKFFTELEELKSGKISRAYSEIMNNVEEFPQDISTQKYASNLSEVLGSDLQKLEKGTVQEISYYDEFSELKITLNEDSSLKVILIEEKDYIAEIEDASLYSFDGRLIIYSRVKYTYYDSKRDLVPFFLTGNQDGVERCDDIDEINIDLCGVNIDKNDEIKTLSEYAIVRKENSFLFYHYGNLLKEIEFSGGNITNNIFDDGYIIDSEKNLYYCYFNDCLEIPEIKFIEIDSNVDIVADGRFEFHTELANYDPTYTLFEGEKLYFPIYKKDGKMYITYADVWVEISYSCNEFNVWKERSNSEISFIGGIETETFALDDAKISYSELRIDDMGIIIEPVEIYYNYVFDKNIKVEWDNNIYNAYYHDEIPNEVWDLNYKILTEEELNYVLDVFKNK